MNTQTTTASQPTKKLKLKKQSIRVLVNRVERHLAGPTALDCSITHCG